MRHLLIPNVGACPLVCIVILFGVGPFRVLAAERIPVKVKGDLVYEYRQESEDAGQDVMQQLKTLNVNANSYIWQPWFAQVMGKMSFSWSEINTEQVKTNNDLVTGDFGLFFLPQSRFPLDMRYDKKNSQISGEQIGRSYTNTHYGVMQRYRNSKGTLTANIGYDHNSQVSDGDQNKEDISNIFRAAVNQRFEKHFFQLHADSNKMERIKTGELIDKQGAVLRYRYKPDSAFTIENMMSVVDNNDNTGGFNRQIYNLQASSYYFWRPQNQPVTLNGGVRYFTLLNDDGFAASKSNNLYANTALRYKINSALRMTANVTLSESQSNTNTINVISTQSIDLSYRPKSIKLGKYIYNWDTSGIVRNRTGADDQRQQFTPQIGHTVQRNLTIDSYSNMNYSFSQRISEELDSVAKSQTRLTNTGSVTWRHSRLGKNAYIRFLLTDSRTSGREIKELYQFANLQFSGHMNFNNSSKLNGSLSIQTVRRSYSNNNDKDKGFDTYSSGNLIYQHFRAFDTPRLRFTSDLKLNAESILPVAFGENNTRRNTWVNRFDYSIGRLDLRLSYRKSSIKRNRHDLLMFRIKRWFN